MKKTLCLLLAAIMCLLVLPVNAGAVRQNGDIDTTPGMQPSDARLLLRRSLGLEKDLPEDSVRRADIDMDGFVTPADARLALRMALGLEYADGNFYENEYDIFRSGFYDARYTLTSEGETMDLRVALTNGSAYIFTTMVPNPDFPYVNIPFTLLLSGDRNFVIVGNETSPIGVRAYLVTGGGTDDLLGDLAGINDAMTMNDLPPLSEGTVVSLEQAGSVYRKTYRFRYSDGTVMDVTMRGKKLEKIETAENGKLVALMDFTKVSLTVAGTFVQAPKSYETIPAEELESVMMLYFLELVDYYDSL